MAKTTTEQAQNSKDKGIIQNIGFKEFATICGEYRIVEKATKELLEIASNPMTNERVQVDIYKWMIEMNVGKAKQMNELVMETKDNEHTGLVVQFTTTRNDLEALEELEKKLLEQGVSQEDIEDAKRERYTRDEDTTRDEYHQQLDDTDNIKASDI